MYNTRGDVDALVDVLKQAPVRSSPRAEGDAAGWAAGRYPQPFASSPAAAAKLLAEDFDAFEERDQKNEYVLDLGRKLPALFELLKKVTPRVQGCMSEVYLVGRRSPDDAAMLEFVADSDAHIVRGLIAILERLYSGQKARKWSRSTRKLLPANRARSVHHDAAPQRAGRHGASHQAGRGGNRGGAGRGHD
jgi:cysteine desulfurase/selenocysteine lyase